MQLSANIPIYRLIVIWIIMLPVHELYFPNFAGFKPAFQCFYLLLQAFNV